MKKKIERTIEEVEILRVTRYFRKVMKLIAKELLAKKYVDFEAFYHIVENIDAEEEIYIRLISLKYKFTETSKPKVTIKCLLQTARVPLRPMKMTGKFSLRIPTYTHRADNYYVNDYQVKIKKGSMP